LRFGGAKYKYKQIFLETIKVGGAQKKFGGHCPRMPPVPTGLPAHQ